MSLPTLSTLNTTQDTNKQLAIIRSYLVQLKDELEAELSNVTYEMLSASLQKRIDAINDEIANNKNVTELVAQNVKASYIYADKVSANALDAAQGQITNLRTEILNAGYIKSDVLESYMVKTDYLVAGTSVIKSACIPDLNAGKITSGTIDSARIDAGQIVSNGLTVSRITAACKSPNDGAMYMGTMNLATLKYYFSQQAGYKSVKPTPLTVNGTLRYFMVMENP